MTVDFFEYVDDLAHRRKQDAREQPTSPVTPAANGSVANYAQAALARELAALRATPPGGRNAQLNRSTFSLSQLVAGGELDEHTVVDELTKAARDIGLDDKEITKTIRSGIAGGGEHPRNTPPPNEPTIVTSPSAAGEERTIGQTFTPGGSFILDTPEHVPAIWGEGSNVVWAEGESLIIAGPPGVGKTTLVGQLVRARLGITEDTLGWPVNPGRRVLYAAMDRPAQIARALRRNFTEHDRDILQNNMRIWSGPPPYDIAKHPETLLHMCQEADADTIILDSLKDACIGLIDDEVGAGYNRARQRALVEGVQVVELHHQTKHGPGGAKPNTLADVYGSAWITAGAGSVVLLWGAAGDPIVTFNHLKQPAEEVGPLRVIHDHTKGQSTVWHGVDLPTLAGKWTPSGGGQLTAKDAARAMFESSTPDRNQVEKARRRLESLVESGRMSRRDGSRGGGETTYAEADLTVLEGP